MARLRVLACLMAAVWLPGCVGGAMSVTGMDGGTKVAAVEPFGTVRPMNGGQTYLRIDETKAARYGAVMNVNGGAWVQAALVRRGDRVGIAYTRPGGPGGQASASPTGTLGYDVWGHTTRNYVRFTEHRWYLDGYGSEARSLRVVPYGDVLGPVEADGVSERMGGGRDASATASGAAPTSAW